MALEPCRECGELVSTEANVCPKCGVTRPTKPATDPRFKGAGAGVLIILFAVVWCVAVASSTGSRNQASHASEATPVLDHKLPWFTHAFAPLCATKEGLANFKENTDLRRAGPLEKSKPTDCRLTTEGEPVAEVDHDGAFDPDYLVRLETGKLAWVPSYGLRN